MMVVENQHKGNYVVSLFRVFVMDVFYQRLHMLFIEFVQQCGGWGWGGDW